MSIGHTTKTREKIIEKRLSEKNNCAKKPVRLHIGRVNRRRFCVKQLIEKFKVKQINSATAIVGKGARDRYLR